MYKSTAKTCNPTNMTFEEFRDGIVLRNYVTVKPEDIYYTKAVLEDQLDINDDQETIFHDEGAMNPYEVYNSEKFLCSSGTSRCDKSFATAVGNQFKSTPAA